MAQSKLDRRLAKLIQRKTDLDLRVPMVQKEALAKALHHDATVADAQEYIAEAAEQVPDKYTQTSFDEAERIQNQLDRALNCQAEVIVRFDHQGSVTNRTNIRFYSDIDLLCVIQAFVFFAPPLKPPIPYQGKPIDELMALRTVCQRTLEARFPEVKVDATKAKCLKLTGGSLRRAIDVVPCSWLHTEAYQAANSKEHLGISILDAKKLNRIDNYPFLHNARIDKRDAETGGALRRLIRLVKSVKYDAEQELKISSYDICALCYTFANEHPIALFDTMQALAAFCKYLYQLALDEPRRAQLLVPNGTRKIFCDEGVSAQALRELTLEMLELLMIVLPEK